jgi:hypothetical protein
MGRPRHRGLLFQFEDYGQVAEVLLNRQSNYPTQAKSALEWATAEIEMWTEGIARNLRDVRHAVAVLEELLHLGDLQRLANALIDAR